MAEGAVAATVLGSAFEIKSNLDAAKAQRRAAEAQARAKRAQAIELLERVEFNIDKLEEEAKIFKESQKAAFAKSGVAINEGAPLVMLEQTNRDLFDEILAQREEAEFKAKMLQRGADVDLQLAGDIREAAKFQALGTLFRTAGRLSV